MRKKLTSIPQKVLLLMSMLVVTLFSPTSLHALDEMFTIGNSIFYYSPQEQCLGAENGCGAKFSFASFNICHGVSGNCDNGVSYKNRLKRSVPVIKNYDIVALQEVRDFQYAEMMKPDVLGDEYSIYPASYKNSEKASTNPILWRKSVFELIKGEKVSGGTTSSSSVAAANPLVKLRYKKTGQEIYAISVHEPVGTSESIAAKRTVSARNLAEKAKSLITEGVPVIIGGDFNSKYQACGVRQNAEGCKKENLPYCILTDNTGLWDAWDAKDNRQGKCPSNDGSDVDHIYTNTTNVVTDYNYGDGVNARGVANNGSDHATLSATITIPGDCGVSSSSTTLVGRTNDEKIFNYFTSRGLSDIQAAGIIGNIAVESRFDPERIQGKAIGEGSKNPLDAGSSGWGLIQWTPAAKVITAANDAGLGNQPIHELSTQLDLVWAHMHNKPPITKGSFSIPDFKEINDIKEAVRYFEDKIEGAGSPNLPDRYMAAELALNTFSGKSSTSPASSTESLVDSCASVGSEAATGNVVQTALNYAWPEYHNPNFLNLKPAYRAAVDKAISEGRYVGGDPHPGVDCGGFITLVMQDSGVDPKYGNGGNTTAQEEYLATSGRYKKIDNPTTDNLTPGAIAIKSSYGGDGEAGHTYMYVGDQPGFETQVASASWSGNSNSMWRAPMAGHEVVADPNYNWYVLK